MLTAMGFATIAAVLGLLLSNRVSAVVALTAAPVAAALAAGFGPAEIGEFAATGIAGVAGTAAMFVFAILYFGVMRDAGLFDPVVRRVLRFAGHNPVTVAVATVVLAMLAHLDGAGATTFLITIPAMLPLYEALGMRRLVLAALTGLGAGIMNLVPWGGPTARAATAIGADANALWVPLIPAQLAGIAACLAIAYLLGRRERTRLAAEAPVPAPAGAGAPGGAAASAAPAPSGEGTAEDRGAALGRPRLFWFNAALTAATVAALVSAVLPPELVFMLALVVALVVNYPGLKAQTDRVNAHAEGAILMASTLLAAGVFLGVMEESGMIEGMARALTGAMPEAVGPGLPLLVGVLAVPLSLLFGPDAYYFAVLPVLTAVGETFGVPATTLAQASIVGEETVGFPISPLTGSFYLLTGLSGVSIGAHIRYLLPWAWLVSLVVLAAAVATGVVPLWAG
ncbi:CitMHS family transporter [Streptomonospora nanhaiensis]|uniref:CitMHS family citrate-Mg2+:H+ or citrate-Ca2+:H+ symporter n=1 Tax=Streptomonospora nanhaiensis TaxID=1323731 RepID=A0A853BMC8_9ACTN|nr:citrate:proton symporter [Streptomonospora nanhaiensis]MBV2363292.1 citrate:proton symporter [Streptomonospora nanhaiensis]MBX9390905.1 citrate:proton symporter [Streptomonospora nanhaiensis]NYI95652.1 CitMHS family citrate-Mg2+:H+ or citrate-Ca2+:H+ symporter [Streptomonospora nanhaiensis]